MNKINKIIHIIDNNVQWNELVGIENNIKNYKIMCIGYNQIENKLLLAEYRTTRNYTNEIITIDTEKTIDILKIFDINVKLIEKFTWSKDTLTKIKGLEQAGFSYVIYDSNKSIVLLDGKMEIDLFNTQERKYIRKTNINCVTEKITINLSDII